MKIETIKKICKKTKEIFIYDNRYVSNGLCMVRFPDRIYPNMGNIFELLSISEIESEKYQVYEFETVPPLFDGGDYAGEEMLQTLGLTIHYQGMDILPMTDGEKVYFVEAEYVRLMKPAMVRYALRSGDIAVFDGLVYLGTVKPVDLTASNLKRVFGKLAEKMSCKAAEQMEIEEGASE